MANSYMEAYRPIVENEKTVTTAVARSHFRNIVADATLTNLLVRGTVFGLQSGVGRIERY